MSTTSATVSWIRSKPLLAISTGLLVLMLLLVALGPRVSVAEAPHAIALPANLESYLTKEETSAGPLIPGTEKHIVWAGQPNTQTDYAIIYLHGFSATRQETAPLSEDLAASLHANLFSTRFAGHGSQDRQALGTVELNDWFRDAREALAIGRRLGRKVIIIGVSNGGALATWLAAHSEQHDIAALVLIAPNFGLKRKTAELLLLPWGNLIPPLLVGKDIHLQAVNEQHARYWSMDYPSSALLPMMGAVAAARSSDLEHLKVPVLLIHSEQDQVVSTHIAGEQFARIGSAHKERLLYTPHPGTDAHVLAGSIRSQANTAEIEAFILNFLQNAQLGHLATATHALSQPDATRVTPR